MKRRKKINNERYSFFNPTIRSSSKQKKKMKRKKKIRRLQDDERKAKVEIEKKNDQMHYRATISADIQISLSLSGITITDTIQKVSKKKIKRNQAPIMRTEMQRIFSIRTDQLLAFKLT
jgi:hypothetical protein